MIASEKMPPAILSASANATVQDLVDASLRKANIARPMRQRFEVHTSIGKVIVNIAVGKGASKSCA